MSAGSKRRRRMERKGIVPMNTRSKRMHVLCLALLGLVACGPSRPAQPEPSNPPEIAESVPEASPRASEPLRSPRYYAGAIVVPGAELGFEVELHREDEQTPWTGNIDIPRQGVRAMQLDDVEVEPRAVTFALTRVGARWSVTLDDEGRPSACQFEQGGATLPCTIADRTLDPNVAVLREPPRPQTPAPPFPYQALEVGYDNTADGVHLAGTLTIPEGEGRHPAVLLVTGSGAQDRDETILGHKPFFVIADHLTRRGIAVLRVDDRGVGGSSGDPQRSTTADFVEDALAGIAFLRAQPGIDPERIGILGHSEGGIIAPAAAVESSDVAFVIMLAGMGVVGSEIVLRQVETTVRAGGGSAEDVERAVASQRAVFELLASEPDEAALRTRMHALLTSASGPADPGLEAKVALATSPWFRHLASYDPRPVLRRLKAPVLVLQGELDTQVEADQNLPEITAALRKAGNRKVTVHRLPGLNHLFQHAKTGLFTEYAEIEETIAPEVLTLIGDWILATKGRR